MNEGCYTSKGALLSNRGLHPEVGKSTLGKEKEKKRKEKNTEETAASTSAGNELSLSPLTVVKEHLLNNNENMRPV